MKSMHLLSMLALGFAGSIYAAEGHVHDHGKDHMPAHGGIVVEANHTDFELVATAETIQLYARELGKAVDVAQGRARLTWLSGKEKLEIELKPAGDKFEAKGVFKVMAGTKAVALVHLPGKPAATARFVLK